MILVYFAAAPIRTETFGFTTVNCICVNITFISERPIWDLTCCIRRFTFLLYDIQLILYSSCQVVGSITDKNMTLCSRPVSDE